MPGQRSTAGGEQGFTLIELVVAMSVLIVGIVGLFAGVDSARKLSLVSERHSTMSHIAEKEIERLEGMNYANVGLSTTPTHSTDPANPDYYVAAGSTNFQYDRSSTATEQLNVDSSNGQVVHVQSWTEGSMSGSIYDYVTWTADPRCSPGCTGTQNYKRITVAVTVGSGLQPTPVYASSVIADPQAEPVQGIGNGNAGNPLSSPATKCLDGSGNTVACVSGIISGNPNTWFLHDWPATGGNPQPPSSNHITDRTVQPLSALTCSTLSFLGVTSGCPIPDLMDSSAPTGSTLYQYSTDAGTGGYSGGISLQPTCTSNCSTSGGGTGSTSDCSNNNWSNGLLNLQNHMWVSSPLTATTTLTGDGALSVFSQAVGGANALVSFCIALYDIPPSNGIAGSLLDILIPGSQPVLLGGAAYVPPANNGSNWPTTPTQTAFTFRFIPSSTTVQVAAGHRLGIRIYAKVNLNVNLNVLYDNPSYPASLQLNSQ